MAWLAVVRERLGRFLADERGAAGLEFLFMSPLLFRGAGLHRRIRPGAALPDRAGRRRAGHGALSGAGPAEAATDGAGNQAIALYPAFLAEADAMLDARMGRDVAMRVGVTTLDTESFRTPFYLVEVTGIVAVDLPMLAFVNLGLTDDVPESLTLMATQQARRGGGNVPGNLGCTRLERIREAC